jgi:hypothetical protein
MPISQGQDSDKDLVNLRFLGDLVTEIADFWALYPRNSISGCVI